MVSTTGLIAYWNFDSDASDSVGSNHGTVSGATNTTGLISNGYSFNSSATTDTITVPYDASLNISGNISISLWVKPTQVNKADEQVFIVKASSFRIGTLKNTNGDLRVNVGTTEYSYTGVPAVSNGAWSHIVYTVTGTTLQIWSNGSKIIDTTVTTLPNTTNDINFGRNNIINDEEYEGLIDEVGIWNRVLSDTEIGELYNSGSGLAYPFSAEPPTGWSGKINGITPAKINGITVANISKVNGV